MYNIDKKEIIRTFKLFYTGGSSMKKIRNILSIALVFVMLIGFAPVNVFADGEGETSTVKTEEEKKADAIAALAGLKFLSEQEIADAKKAITNASNEEGINNAKKDAETKNTEAEKTAKEEAVNKIKDLNNLAKDEKEEIEKNINKAESKEAVEKLVKDATDKDKKAKELAEAKEKAKEKVDKDDAIKDKDKAKKAIDAAKSQTEIDKALEDAKKPAENSTTGDNNQGDKDNKGNTNPPAPAAKTYTIYPKTVGNGTVSTVSESEAGKTITVEATPAYGYVVDRIVVTNLETDRSVPVNYTHKSYFNDYPYYLRSRWHDDYPYDYDDYIRWCDRNGYSRYDSDNYRIWCRRYGYRYDYDDFRRWYDWDDVYGYRWYNRYDYSYYDKAQFTMPASHVKVTVTFTSAPYWYDGYYYDYETGTYRYYYDDDYYYYRNRKNKKSNYYERQAEKDKKEEEEAKAKAEAEKLPQVYENKAVIAIGSNVLDKVSKNVHTVHQMDTPAYVKNGRVMLPLRYVAEALGLQVSWVPETKTVIIWDLTQRVEIPVKSNRIIVNGITYTSDVKPEIKSSRTMLPIANIARALGLIDGSDIIWDQYNKQVTLTRKVLSK